MQDFRYRRSLRIFVACGLFAAGIGLVRAEKPALVMITSRHPPHLAFDPYTLRNVFLKKIFVDKDGQRLIPVNLPRQFATAGGFRAADHPSARGAPGRLLESAILPGREPALRPGIAAGGGAFRGDHAGSHRLCPVLPGGCKRARGVRDKAPRTDDGQRLRRTPPPLRTRQADIPCRHFLQTANSACLKSSSLWINRQHNQRSMRLA